jgi:hypothetical protein
MEDDDGLDRHRPLDYPGMQLSIPGRSRRSTKSLDNKVATILIQQAKEKVYVV